MDLQTLIIIAMTIFTMIVIMVWLIKELSAAWRAKKWDFVGTLIFISIVFGAILFFLLSSLRHG